MPNSSDFRIAKLPSEKIQISTPTLDLNNVGGPGYFKNIKNSKLAGAGSGIIGGIVGSAVGNALGGVFGSSKVGQAASSVVTGALGNVGSQAAAQVGSNIASGAGAFSGVGLSAPTSGSVANLACEAIGAMLPAKTEYSGDKGNITATADAIYDGVMTGVNFIPGIGQGISAGMAGVKLMGRGINALGGGTDGMCVCAGTKVFTKEGKIVNIEDLKKEDGIIGYNGKSTVPQTIHDFITPIQKQCIEIKTNTGDILKCSIDHPIYQNMPKGKSKFTEADQLKIGDTIALAKNIDYWGTESTDLSYLIGVLLGKGVLTDYWRVIIENPYTIIDNKYVISKIGNEYTIKNIDLFQNVFDNIYRYNKKTVGEILAGLFDAIGTINLSYLEFKGNKELLLNIKRQLHKLGILSTLKTNRLVIDNLYSIKLFARYIPNRLYRGVLEEFVEDIKNSRSYTYNTTITEINSIGIQTVYNLETNEDHTYLAEGIITHNTTTDALLGSSFAYASPLMATLSMINGFGGKKANVLTKDTEAFAQTGSSYSGTSQVVDSATHYSGKKFGLFSGSDRRGANAFMNEAGIQQAKVRDIGDYSKLNNQILSNQSSLTANDSAYQQAGGYDMTATRAAKYGMKFSKENIQKVRQMLNPYNYDKLEEQTEMFKSGGQMNLLPEGALHKNKHHIDNIDNITQKGIPVVTQSEGGKISQQAEIEKEEIILAKDITTQIEDLYDKYKESKEDKYVIEAGKILSESIITNTDDKTGLIETIE